MLMSIAFFFVLSFDGVPHTTIRWTRGLFHLHALLASSACLSRKWILDDCSYCCTTANKTLTRQSERRSNAQSRIALHAPETSAQEKRVGIEPWHWTGLPNNCRPTAYQRRCAWTGFWIFWIRIPAASNRIRSEVFFPVAGSGGFGFCVYWKDVTVWLGDIYLPGLNRSRMAWMEVGIRIFWSTFETKRMHLDAAIFQFMGSIRNCIKDDVHKSSLLDLPSKLLTTIKHRFK